MRWIVTYTKPNHPTEYWLVFNWLSVAQAEAEALDELGFITKIMQDRV